MKSAKHQPQIVYGRQKAELSAQHLDALKCSGEKQKQKQKKHRLAESQLLTAASDVEQEGETQGVKSEKEHACGTHT